MKTIKITLTILSLFLVYAFAGAQNCHGDNVMVYKGGVRCGCSCKKKCVSPEEVPTYEANGWSTWGCLNCCWVNANDPNRSHEADIAITTPDHSANEISVSFPPSIETNVTIRVTDMTGRYVETVDTDFLEGKDNTLAWDNSGLNPGIYFLHINAGAITETKMISITD